MFAKEAIENWREYLEKAYKSDLFIYINGQLEKCPDTQRVHV